MPIPCNCICPCLTPSLVLLGLNQSATGELKIYSTHASLPPPQARSAHSSANLMIVYSTCFSYSCHRRHTSSALGDSARHDSIKVHIHVLYPAVPSPSPSRNPASLRSVGKKRALTPRDHVICMCCASRDSMTPPVASTLVRPASSGIGRDDTSSHPGVIVASTHSRRYRLCSFRDRFLCCLLQTSRRVSGAWSLPPSTAAFSNSWRARYLHQHSPLLSLSGERASERRTC